MARNIKEDRVLPHVHPSPEEPSYTCGQYKHFIAAPSVDKRIEYNRYDIPGCPSEALRIPSLKIASPEEFLSRSDNEYEKENNLQ